MTVLTVVQDACDQIGLTRPSTVVTSTDTQVRQLFGLLKAEGEALSRYQGEGDVGGWQALQAEHTFVTVAQAEQTGTPIPDDFRYFIPNSFFNRSTMRPISGPLTPQQWQLLQARPALAAVYLAYRQRAGTFLIGPTPTAGETIAYEYISKYWAISSAGTAKATFTSDDDTSYLDEELLKLGLIWRWKHAKGLDYGEDLATYERAKAAAYGSDGGSTMLSVGGPCAIEFPERLQIPEGNWGV